MSPDGCQSRARAGGAEAAVGCVGRFAEKNSICFTLGHGITRVVSPNSRICSRSLRYAGQSCLSVTFGFPFFANATIASDMTSDSRLSESDQSLVFRNRFRLSSVPSQYGTSPVWYAPTVAGSWSAKVTPGTYG